MRILGVLFIVVGLLATGVVTASWVSAYLGVRNQPGGGEGFLYLTVGAIAFLGPSLFFVGLGIVMFIRGKRRNPNGPRPAAKAGQKAPSAASRQ
jgi:hypothetical protein